MKRALPIFLNLFLGLILLARTSRAQEVMPPRSGIVLNGITSILGDKLGLFKITFADGTPPVSFMLAEGQSRYGIQLVSVHARSNAVTIRNDHLTQVISICQTPDLPMSRPGPVDFSGSADTSNPAARRNDQAYAMNGNAPASQPGSYGGAASGASTSPDAGADPNSVSDSNGANGSSSSSGGHVYQWWVKEAQKIENARQETAQRVLAGEWEPYPLTPLTPAGTPAALIGEKSLFMNHGPGMMVAGQ